MDRLSDNYYVEQVLSGETDAFSFLLNKYSRQVFSLIVRMVGNREDAEELTQDVFIKAYRSLPQFRGDSSFSTWIYRIAYNIAVSATRKRKPETVPIDDNILSNVPDEPDDAFLENTDASMRVFYLNRALERLTPEERSMIVLFYKDNRSMDEIAKITGLTETNVKTKIFRIRKKLYVWIKSMEKETYETE